jgi:hypothetical protein
MARGVWMRGLRGEALLGRKKRKRDVQVFRNK